MTNRITFSLLLASLMIPALAMAEVRITEVAWMGSDGNANAEWIELGNDGAEAVSLSGWKIGSSSGAPTITLTGTISPSGYYLLTRTNTNILPGVTGDQAYTGALSNGGATLTLTDSTGAVMDTVVGGSNWESIGGDNTTKYTPQRTDAGTWVTAAPTPRAANAQTGSTPEEPAATTTPSTTPATTTPAVSIGGSVAPAPTTPYRPIYIYAGPNRIVSTHALTPFEAVVFDGDRQVHRGVTLTWNFGDGTSDMGRLVTHAYEYPGTYLVVIRTEEGGSSVIATLTVVVRDAQLTVTTLPQGVQIENTGADIADITHWTLEQEHAAFILPNDTAVLPGARIVIPHSVSNLRAGPVSLHYPSGAIASIAAVQQPEPSPAPPVVPVRPRRSEPAPAPVAEEPLSVGPKAEESTPTALNHPFLTFMASAAAAILPF